MAKMFEKVSRLVPSTMATVAERRFGDAEALSATRLNARANGVVYLVGFVVEILLKAQLVRRTPELGRAGVFTDASTNALRGLVWRSHDLEKMVAALPEVEADLKALGERAGTDYMAELKKVCAAWTIQASYSSQTIVMRDADLMLGRVRVF